MEENYLLQKAKALLELRELCKSSASIFSEELLEYEGNQRFENPWHIEIIYDILDNRLTQDPETGKIIVNRSGVINRKVALRCPRNHAKSTAVSVNWNLKEHYRNPNDRTVIASNAASQSSAFLREQVSHIEKGERLQQVMGDIKPQKPDKWTDDSIIINRTTKKKDPTVSTVGSGGKILSKRADTIVLDDLLDPENTKTPEQRMKVKFWVDNVLMPVREPKTGRIIIIGTAWYKDDYLDERMKDPTYQVRLDLRALIRDSLLGVGSDDENAMDIREVFSDEVIDLYGIDASSGVMWPERWPMSELMSEKEGSGSVSFNRQYMNIIFSEETQIIKTEWLTHAKQLGVNYDFLAKYDPATSPYGPLPKRATGTDLAISQKATADWTVFITVGQDKNGMIYILNIERGKFSPAQTRNKFVTEYHKFTPQKMKVENNAYQASLEKDLIDHTDLPIEGYTTGGEKFDEFIGINSIGVLFENGKIVLPYNYEKNPRLKPLIDQLVYECEAFGSEVHTGDMLMALWFAITGLRELGTVQQVITNISGQGFYKGRKNEDGEE